MNYEYAIGLCIALVLLMLWVDVALRKVLKRSASCESLKRKDWDALPTWEIIIREVDNGPQRPLFFWERPEFKVYAFCLYPSLQSHPHYVALNFV